MLISNWVEDYGGDRLVWNQALLQVYPSVVSIQLET